MSDKIGIIIPVYNAEKYIANCLKSICNQTYDNFKVFIVDDGSTDEGGAFCDEYAKRDDRIAVIHQENKGLSGARNCALEKLYEEAECKYLTFVDADDWLDPFYLEALYDAIKRENTPLSACNFEDIEVDADNNVLKIPAESKETRTLEAVHHYDVQIMDTEDYYCTYHPIGVPVWAKLYDAELFRTIRFPVGIIHEDVYVCHEVLFSKKAGERRKIAFLNLPLYEHVRTDGSITRSPWNRARLKVFGGYLLGIDFARKYGYPKFLVRQMKSYLWHLQDQKTSILSQDKITFIQRIYVCAMWVEQKYRTFLWRKELGKKLFRARR